MAEHLAFLQEIDHDLIVEELHSPGPHHVEEPRGRSPLLQDRRSLGEELDLGRRADPFQGVRLEGVEGREANEEGLDLHPAEVSPTADPSAERPVASDLANTGPSTPSDARPMRRLGMRPGQPGKEGPDDHDHSDPTTPRQPAAGAVPFGWPG